VSPTSRVRGGSPALGLCALLALSQSPGERGIGDPYFPDLGGGGYDTRHYDLVLEVDMQSRAIEAVATLSCTALDSLSSFNLDFQGLKVSSLAVDGEAAEFLREGRELTVTPAEPLAQDAEFLVRVAYAGIPVPVVDSSSPVGGVGWCSFESGVYVTSQVVGAASWFPCNDHPLDKATYSITVTAPKPYTVAANGRLVEEVDLEDRRRFTFRAARPMATYLVTVNIAEFEVIEEQGPRGLPIRTYHPVGASPRELAPFRRQGEILEFLETRFGPYPFESAGAVIAYEFLGFALETQTLVVYGRGMTEEIIVHELAHQWFGDCVSTASWKDIWLNEGFATYAEHLWTEHERGAEAAEYRARRTYQRLRRRRVGPPADPGVRQLFSDRTYQRGAWVLHCLRREVGDEVFFAILREWVRAHRDSAASTEDFIALCEARAERELDDFFAGVLYAAVIPPDARYE